MEAFIITISVLAFILLMLGLCKAAAAGNIYCPQCGSEDNIPADIHEVGCQNDGRIFRICKSCNNIW